jgi:hypothetical protein
MRLIFFGSGSQTISGPGATTYTVGAGPQFYNWNLTKGLANTDVAHQFVAQATCDIPVGKGRRWMDRGGIAHMFLGGWTFLTVASGQNINVSNYSLTRTIAWRERYKLTVRMDANNFFPETHAFLCCNVNDTVNLTSPQLFGKTPALSYSFSNRHTPIGNFVGVLRIEF